MHFRKRIAQRDIILEAMEVAKALHGPGMMSFLGTVRDEFAAAALELGKF